MFRNFTLALAALALAVSCGARSVEDHAAFARLQFEKGQYREAIRSLKTALQEAPDRPELHLLMAKIRAARGEYDLGLESLEIVLARRPGDLEAGGLAVRCHLASGRPDLAVDLASAVAAATEDRVGGRLLVARAHRENARHQTGVLLDSIRLAPGAAIEEFALLLDRGRMGDARRRLAALPPGPEVRQALDALDRVGRERESALAAVEEALRSAPDRVEALLLRGLILREAGRWSEARGDLERAVALEPVPDVRRKALRELVAVRQVLGDVTGALEAAGALLLEDPSNAEDLLTRALLRVRTGDLPGALEDARVLEEVRPDIPFAAYVEGIVLVVKGESEKALPLLARASALRDDPGPQFWSGLALRATGKRDLAVSALQGALVIDRNHGGAHLALAACLAEEDRLPEALDHAERAVEVLPGSIPAQLLVARICARRVRELADSPTEAAPFRARLERALEAMIAIRPDDPLGRSVLARWRISNGQLEEAAFTLTEGLAERPEDRELLRALAALEVRRGRPDKARDALRAAIRENPDDARSYLELAELCRRSGDRAAVISTLTRLLERRPDASLGRLRLASALLADGRAAAADEVLLEEIRETGGSPDVLFGRVQLLRRTGEEGKLLDALRAAAEKAPDDPRSLDLVPLLLDHGAAREALDRATAAAKRDADHPLVLTVLALARSDVGEGDAAESARRARDARPADVFLTAHLVGQNLLVHRASWTESLIRGTPGLAAPARRALLGLVDGEKAGEEGIREALRSLNLAIAYHLTSRWPDRAARHAEASLRRHPGNVIALEILAHSRVAQHDFAGAAAAYRRMLAVEPDFPAARLRVAELSVAAGAGEEALGELDGLVTGGAQIEPFAASLRLEIAIRAHRAGDVERAMRLYEAVLAADPGAVKAANNLAFLYAERRERLARARELAERAVEASGRDPRMLDTLAFVRMKSGDVEGAVALLDEALRKSPGDPDLLRRREEAVERGAK